MRQIALEFFEVFSLPEPFPVVVDTTRFCQDRFDAHPQRSVIVAPNGTILFLGAHAAPKTKSSLALYEGELVIRSRLPDDIVSKIPHPITSNEFGGLARIFGRWKKHKAHEHRSSGLRRQQFVSSLPIGSLQTLRVTKSDRGREGVVAAIFIILFGSSCFLFIQRRRHRRVVRSRF